MSLSAVQLCSHALTKLGCRTIQSLSEPAVEAVVAASVYFLSVEGMYLAHPWSFSLRRARLNGVEAEPSTSYSFVHQMPSNVFRLLNISFPGACQDIEHVLIGQEIYTDQKSIIITYQDKPVEDAFPEYFAPALVARLAAEMCLPLTENTARADFLLKRASAEFQIARRADIKFSAQPAIHSFPLIEARFG